jgi:hypothetical protein
MELNNNKKGHVKIDIGRQGSVILAYIIVLLGYYGIIANIVMVEQWISLTNQTWMPFTEMDKTVLFWTFEVYASTFFLPLILLFITCFLLTYREDIPHYGIKASIWLVPFIIAEAFIFYTIMFGFSAEPFILQFGNWKGYVNIIILFAVTLSGAISGMKVKQLVESKRKV